MEKSAKPLRNLIVGGKQDREDFHIHSAQPVQQRQMLPFLPPHNILRRNQLALQAHPEIFEITDGPLPLRNLFEPVFGRKGVFPRRFREFFSQIAERAAQLLQIMRQRLIRQISQTDALCPDLILQVMGIISPPRHRIVKQCGNRMARGEIDTLSIGHYGFTDPFETAIAPLASFNAN